MPITNSKILTKVLQNLGINKKINEKLDFLRKTCIFAKNNIIHLIPFPQGPLGKSAITNKIEKKILPTVKNYLE